MLSRIQATSKLYFLATIMSVFIIGIGIYGISQIKVMNRNTQTMYTDRVSALQQLTAIRFSYTVGILSLVQATKNHQFTLSEAKSKVEKAEERISSNWNAYMLTYLTPEEGQLAKQTSASIDQSLITIQKLKNILNKEDTLALNDLSSKELYQSVNPVIVKVSDLIDLQIKIGAEVYKNSNDIYDAAIKKFLIIICLSLLFTIPFSYYLIREVKFLIHDLQISIGKITESEAKYHSLIEHAGDPIFVLNEDTSFNDVNTSACKLLGYSHEEFLSMNLNAIFSAEDLRKQPLRLEATSSNKTFLSDHKLKRKNGTTVDVELNVKGLEGKGYLAIARDITERKKMEDRLAEHEEQLTLFIEHSPASLAMLDNDMRYIITSRRWTIDYNLEGQDLIGKNHYEIFPEIPQHWKDIHQRCLKGAVEKNEEEAFIRHDGSKEWLRWEIRPWHKASGDIGGIIMFTEVVTDRKQATELFKYQFENSPDTIIIINKFFKIETINKNIPGIPVESLIGMDYISILPVESQSASGEAIERCFETAQGQEIENIIRSGIWARCRFVPIITDSIVSQVMIFWTDITNRKHAEEKLKQSEEKYRNIFENVQDVFFQTSLSGIILDVSPSIKSLIGMTREELVGTEVIDIYYDPEYREKMLNVLKEKGELRDFELQFRTISGEPVHVSVNAHLIPDINGNKSHIDGTLINITERKFMESERQRIINDLLQRNRDLEQFAYIVSHNLRAPVANIIGITDYIEDTGINPDEKHEMIKGLSISVNKLDSVIKDLNDILQMKREISEKKETVEFSGLLNDIKLSIANLIEKEKVSFISDFDAIDEMKTIKSYLYSIFYNLISNSIKYKRPNTTPVIEIRTALSGNIIEITFKDNGLGIDLKKRKEQIFGLYKRFHTHSDGKGMGLYMVKNQVEVLGGKISIQSEVNKGTEFKIEFENSL